MTRRFFSRRPTSTETTFDDVAVTDYIHERLRLVRADRLGGYQQRF